MLLGVVQAALFLLIRDPTIIILLTYALQPNHNSAQRFLSTGELALHPACFSLQA
jgi:hypothetical protein